MFGSPSQQILIPFPNSRYLARHAQQEMSNHWTCLFWLILELYHCHLCSLMDWNMTLWQSRAILVRHSFEFIEPTPIWSSRQTHASCRTPAPAHCSCLPDLGGLRCCLAVVHSLGLSLFWPARQYFRNSFICVFKFKLRICKLYLLDIQIIRSGQIYSWRQKEIQKLIE